MQSWRLRTASRLGRDALQFPASQEQTECNQTPSQVPRPGGRTAGVTGCIPPWRRSDSAPSARQDMRPHMHVRHAATPARPPGPTQTPTT
eukprot:366000-Chlamydomonas_euryale.AAC.30